MLNRSSFNNKAFINFTKTYTTEKKQYLKSNTELFSETKQFKNKNGFMFSVNFPKGCSAHLSKTKNILNRIYLSYEVRPEYNQAYIPEIGMIGNSFLQHGGGIRIMLD